MRGPVLVALALAALVACSAPAGERDGRAGAATAVRAAPRWPAGWTLRAEPVRAEHGLVVSAEAHASRVGCEVLRAGGNAVDAAIATSFALAVTYPRAGNLGGGGFLVARLADGTEAALDFREQAPQGASRDMFLDDRGRPTDRSLDGALAAGVPGTVRGLWEAHARFGSRPWAELLAPAVRLAGEGFGPDPSLRAGVREALATIEALDDGRRAACAGTVAAFTPALTADRFRQPGLAATLEQIAEHGADAFYTGPLAERIAAGVQAGGGVMTADDLARYTAVWREPVRLSYRDHTIVTMPPSSSGGATMGAIAAILSGYALDELAWDDPLRLHLLAEAMKRAYADRNAYLGDPAFVDNRLAAMISAGYGARRRTGIDTARATPSRDVAPGLGPLPPAGSDTTHLSVVDAQGGAVSLTTTLNTNHGCLVTVEGFLLNNEMDDFAVAPGLPNAYGLVQGEANAIEPGKRMLSSMSPSIVLDPQGELLMVTGTPGGSRIISTTFQTIAYAIDCGFGVADVVAAPRVHHQHLPDVLFHEEGGLPQATLDALAAMGHACEVRDPMGEVAAIMIDADGVRVGAADPRGTGLAAGY